METNRTAIMETTSAPMRASKTDLPKATTPSPMSINQPRWLLLERPGELGLTGIYFLVVSYSFEFSQMFMRHVFLGDGSHASATGTYLTACIMFHTIWGETPVGNSYQPVANSEALQRQAGMIVTGSSWSYPTQQGGPLG